MVQGINESGFNPKRQIKPVITTKLQVNPSSGSEVSRLNEDKVSFNSAMKELSRELERELKATPSNKGQAPDLKEKAVALQNLLTAQQGPESAEEADKLIDKLRAEYQGSPANAHEIYAENVLTLLK